jgi:hypothetical protein
MTVRELATALEEDREVLVDLEESTRWLILKSFSLSMRR